ncbi:MAG: radical SAM protein [Flavobacteriales bacterium]|nr:radical SAM protein [Flavobacteriales bacterium]
MYFNVFGEVGPCWLNLVGMGQYPEHSIRDIWFGEKFSRLRNAILEKDLAYKCRTCHQAILDGNHHSVLSKLYDHPYGLTDYPSVMEFELSNRCNLECVMCKGDLSSTIRQNREKRPALSNPYDEAFVEQLEEFIPHLKEAKFLGGEPFLIEEYYGIWERMIELNPNINLTVTTNGSVLNNRVQKLLTQLKFNIIISIDSFQKDVYEDIRIRGSFDRVMLNFHSFLDYSKQAGTYFQVSMNPLRRNMWQLHEYVDFCNEHGANLWFNTVVYPHRECIRTLPHEKLSELYDFLKGKKLKPRKPSCSKQVYFNNAEVFNNFVENQLQVWMTDQKETLERCRFDAESMTVEEFSESLERTLKKYVLDDAYLLEQEKQKQLDTIEKQLHIIKTTDPFRTRSLAKFSASEIMESWLAGEKI